MLIFDQKTLADWRQRDITDVSCFLIQAGCAGEKVSVIEGIHEDTGWILQNTDGMTFHTREIERLFFENCRISHVGSKWIVSADSLNTHCGCGSSFSRKTGNPLQDKISQMKEKMRQKKEKAHS